MLFEVCTAEGHPPREERLGQYDFICMDNVGQDIPTSPLEWAKLMQAGLGLENLSFIVCIYEELFHQELQDAHTQTYCTHV